MIKVKVNEFELEYEDYFFFRNMEEYELLLDTDPEKISHPQLKKIFDAEVMAALTSMGWKLHIASSSLQISDQHQCGFIVFTWFEKHTPIWYHFRRGRESHGHWDLVRLNKSNNADSIQLKSKASQEVLKEWLLNILNTYPKYIEALHLVASYEGTVKDLENEPHYHVGDYTDLVKGWIERINLEPVIVLKRHNVINVSLRQQIDQWVNSEIGQARLALLNHIDIDAVWKYIHEYNNNRQQLRFPHLKVLAWLFDAIQMQFQDAEFWQNWLRMHQAEHYHIWMEYRRIDAEYRNFNWNDEPYLTQLAESLNGTFAAKIVLTPRWQNHVIESFVPALKIAFTNEAFRNEFLTFITEQFRLNPEKKTTEMDALLAQFEVDHIDLYLEYFAS